MKIAVIFLAVFAFTAVAYAQDSSQHSRKQRAVISVAATTAAVRDGRETRADVLLLWNRNIRTTPIGNAVKTCVKFGSGGISGGGLMNCVISLQMPNGKIVASGTVHDTSRYTLVTTGGTGEYEGVRGPLFVRRVADGVLRLTFTI